MLLSLSAESSVDNNFTTFIALETICRKSASIVFFGCLHCSFVVFNSLQFNYRELKSLLLSEMKARLVDNMGSR